MLFNLSQGQVELLIRVLEFRKIDNPELTVKLDKIILVLKAQLKKNIQ